MINNRGGTKSSWVSSCLNAQKYGTLYDRILYRAKE